MKSAPQWRTTILAIVGDLESHLAASAPKHAKLRLEEFRQRLARAKNRREAAAIETELEVLIRSRPYYRGAARRSVRSDMRAAISGLEELLSLVKQYNAMWRKRGPTEEEDT